MGLNTFSAFRTSLFFLYLFQVHIHTRTHTYEAVQIFPQSPDIVL